MALELKPGHKVHIAIDRSGSMNTDDCEGRTTRYDNVRELITDFVSKAANLNGGVALFLFNNHVEEFTGVSDAGAVRDIMGTHKPGGGTATDLAIQASWAEHQKLGNETTYLVIFTDGDPSNPAAVKSTIVNITKTMKNPEEYRILFFTVGQRSAELSAFLEQLDSDLEGAAYDIVGVEEATSDFEGAITDLIASSTTAGEAAAGGGYAGKVTEKI